MSPPQASRYPDGGQGRGGGGRVSEPDRRPGPLELGRPALPPPQAGRSSQPDPVDELIGEATDYAYLMVAAVLALAIVVVIVLVTS